MALKKFKATTPGRRHMTIASFEEITTNDPEKSLTFFIKNKAGRASHGKISVRRRGGGHKRLYRMVDFKRNKINIKATVTSIEYDPNRTAYIMLVNYTDGEKRYHIAPQGMKVGDEIVTSEKTRIVNGNRLMIKNIPVGFNMFDVEISKGKGAQIVRSAGSFAQLVSVDDEKYAQIKMPSGEIRYVPKDCFATIGTVSNSEHSNITIGKAGRTRWLRKRPSVRGKAMNPVDHPHGGGEARNSIGLKYPKTPWGRPALGKKTRRKQSSDRLIIQRKK